MYTVPYEELDPSKTMTIKIDTMICIEKIKQLMGDDKNASYIKAQLKMGTLYTTLYDPTRIGGRYAMVDLTERVGTIIDINLEEDFIKINRIMQPIYNANEDELIAIPRALYRLNEETQDIEEMYFITFDLDYKVDNYKIRPKNPVFITK